MMQHFFADFSLFFLSSQFLLPSIFFVDFPHLLPELWPDDDQHGNDDVEDVAQDLLEDHVSEEVYCCREEDFSEDHVG